MADLVTKDELEAGLKATEIRLLQRIDERIDASELRLLERIDKSETNLLREFHKWAQIADMRLRNVEFSTSGLTERMALLETRVNDLERR